MSEDEALEKRWEAAQQWAASKGLMLVPAWVADMVEEMVEDNKPLKAALKREQKRLARLLAASGDT